MFKPLSLDQLYGFALIEDKYLPFQARCDELSQLFGGARLTYTIPITGQYVVTALLWFFPDSAKANSFAFRVESELGSQGRGMYALKGYLDGVIPDPVAMVNGMAVGWNNPLGEPVSPPPPEEPVPPPPEEIPPLPPTEINLFPLVPLSFGMLSSLMATVF